MPPRTVKRGGAAAGTRKTARTTRGSQKAQNQPVLEVPEEPVRVEEIPVSPVEEKEDVKAEESGDGFNEFVLISFNHLLLRRIKSSEATLSGEFTPYNIVPLEAPSLTNAIGIFPEVRSAISAIRYTEHFPRLPDDYVIVGDRDADMFDLLEIVFGFQKLMFYNDNEETDCENPKCGKRCLPTPRARTYVQLDDGTELLDAVMFGDVAENIFSCTAVQLRSYSDEKHKLFVQKTTKQLSAKKWRIQLYVDANRTMTSKYNQFTIQAVEPMED